MVVTCISIYDCLDCLLAAEGWLTYVQLNRYRNHADLCGCDVCAALRRTRSTLEWIRRDPAKFQPDETTSPAQQAPGPAGSPPQAAGTGTGYAG